MTRQPEIRSEQLTLLGNEQALREWDALGVDEELQVTQLVEQAAGVAGVSPSQAAVSSASGIAYRVEFLRPVKDPETGATVSEFGTQLLFGALESGHGQQIGVMATTMSALAPAGAGAVAENKVVRALQQEQPGDWATATEYTLDAAGGLVEADGVWDAFRGCLGGCGGPCLAALTSCLGAGALPAVAACVAVRCGGCALRCAACVACDCGWLCRIAVGCCHR